MSWGVYPRLSRAAALTAPRHPICLDAAAYSLPGPGGERVHARYLYGDVAMGIAMYLRPRQVMTVFCSAKVPGNVELVADAVEKLCPRNRARVRVAVHDGAYDDCGWHGGCDGYRTITAACERAWRAYHTAELQEVAVGYVFSRAHRDTPKFASQLRALTEAHAAGHIAFVGLAMPRALDLAAAMTVLSGARVPVRIVVAHPTTEQPATPRAWAAAGDVELFSYNQAHALSQGATHISAARRGYEHMRNWASAAFARPAITCK